MTNNWHNPKYGFEIENHRLIHDSGDEMRTIFQINGKWYEPQETLQKRNLQIRALTKENVRLAEKLEGLKLAFNDRVKIIGMQLEEKRKLKAKLAKAEGNKK